MSLSLPSGGGPVTQPHKWNQTLRRFAQTAGVSEGPLLAIAKETAERAIEAWRILPERDLLPKHMTERIGRHLEKAARRTLNGSG